MKAPKPAPPSGAPEATLWFGGPIEWFGITLLVTGDELIPDDVKPARRVRCAFERANGRELARTRECRMDLARRLAVFRGDFYAGTDGTSAAWRAAMSTVVSHAADARFAKIVAAVAVGRSPAPTDGPRERSGHHARPWHRAGS